MMNNIDLTHRLRADGHDIADIADCSHCGAPRDIELCYSFTGRAHWMRCNGCGVIVDRDARTVPTAVLGWNDHHAAAGQFRARRAQSAGAASAEAFHL